MKIDSFKKEHFFLSNFYPVEFEYDGITYQNSEAAFQAQKTLDINIRKEMSKLNPSRAKQLGRSVVLRPDWENVKDNIMYDIVLSKFAQNPDLIEKLLNTKDAELIEGNEWNDIYWGVCNGKGENKLGNILMNIRSRKDLALLIKRKENENE